MGFPDNFFIKLSKMYQKVRKCLYETNNVEVPIVLPRLTFIF